MEKQRIVEVTNEVARHYSFMKQEDVDVMTCGYCHECPEWHVYGYKNFLNICKTLEMEPQRQDNHDFIMFNRVKIFCLY